MSEPLPELSRGTTPSQLLVQKVGVLLAKACLSSIPFAALAFDVGQAGIDVANARVLDRFLEELGVRIQSLEAKDKDRLRDDPLHQIAAQACLRSLLEESDARIASALARGVAELTTLEVPFDQRAECARVLGRMSEPMLHCLQTYHRFELGCLNESELAKCSHARAEQRDNERNRLGLLLAHSIPLLSWGSVIESIMQLGLIQHIIDSGVGGELPEAVTVAPVTPLGHRILTLCFYDPTLPTFGYFAAP